MPQDFGLGLKSRKKNSECMIISVKRKNAILLNFDLIGKK